MWTFHGVNVKFLKRFFSVENRPTRLDFIQPDINLLNFSDSLARGSDTMESKIEKCMDIGKRSDFLFEIDDSLFK